MFDEQPKMMEDLGVPNDDIGQSFLEQYDVPNEEISLKNETDPPDKEEDEDDFIQSLLRKGSDYIFKSLLG